MKFSCTVILIMCMTMEVTKNSFSDRGGPSAPPANVHVDYVGPSTIIVKWEQIDLEHWNGRLRGYRGYNVKYGPTLSNGSYSEVKNKKVNSPRQSEATLPDLERNTEYRIEVAGVNEMGEGVYSEPVKAQTYDPCDSGPCHNGGTCTIHNPSDRENSKSNVFYCVCAVNFTGVFCTSFISDLQCYSPNVSMPNLSPDVSSALAIRRSSQFLFQSDVSLDCDLSHRTTFTWSVFQLNIEEIPVLSRNSSSELQITPRLLPIGVYLVRLTVVMLGTPVFGVSQGYFKITSSPLVAFIAGGSKVVRGFNRTLVFNASMSYDPDDENQQLSSLNFTWLCRQESLQQGLDDSDQERCSNAGDVKDDQLSESVLRVSSSHMVENSSYFLTVYVKKDQRQAEYTQEVFIVPGDPPDVYVRCVDNCDVKINPSSRMALQGICAGASCGGTLTYKWSLFKHTNNTSNETQWVEISAMQELISTRLSSTTLVTYPGVLTPNVRYKFVLTAKRQGGHPGYSEYQITTNSPPAGGTCSVSPSSGVTLSTEFTFRCTDWQDADFPLQYEFVYFTNNELLNVVYKGVKGSKETKLPAGEKTNNLTIDFRVRVADMFGAFTEVKTPVQVLEPNIEAANLVDVVANLTTGEGSELTSLIQSGDLSSAVQLAAAAIAAVDVAAQTQTENQDELTEKRIAMKSSIVQQLTAVQAETVVRVQQVSNVIAQATSVISEVTVEAQKAATDALQKMTIVLKKESTAGESYETLFDGAKSLVTGLGSMLRVSSHEARVYDSESLKESYNNDKFITAPSAQHFRKYRKRNFGKRISLLSHLLVKRKKRDADYEASETQLQSKKQVLSMFNSLEEVGSTILSRTLVGEAPSELSAQYMSLLVSREDPDLLAGSVLSSKGSSFTFPTVPNLFGNGTQFVDSQVGND